MKKLRAAVVSYNGLSFLKDCITSLKQAGVKDIMVSDNASKDGSRDWLLEMHRDVKLIISYINRGFGSAVNQMIDEAVRQNIGYLLLLNQDTEIDASMISELTKCLDDDKSLALVSPLQKTADGNFEYEFKKNCDRLNIPLDSNETMISVPFVNAACWLMNLNAVKRIGGFNPVFFMYGEDLNYCQRAIHLGYKVGLCNDAVVIHKKPENDYQSSLRKWCRVTSSYYLTKCLQPDKPERTLDLVFDLLKRFFGAIFSGRVRESLVYVYSFFRLFFLWPKLGLNRKNRLKSGAFLSSINR